MTHIYNGGIMPASPSAYPCVTNEKKKFALFSLWGISHEAQTEIQLISSTHSTWICGDNG